MTPPRLISDAPHEASSAKAASVTRGRSTPPYWLGRALELREQGLSFAKIGAAIGRSAPCVHRALTNGPRSSKISESGKAKRQAQRQSPEQGFRYELRAAARDEAKRTGQPVEEIYARLGVTAFDRALLYDQRRRA